MGSTWVWRGWGLSAVYSVTYVGPTRIWLLLILVYFGWWGDFEMGFLNG